MSYYRWGLALGPWCLKVEQVRRRFHETHAMRGVGLYQNASGAFNAKCVALNAPE